VCLYLFFANAICNNTVCFWSIVVVVVAFKFVDHVFVGFLVSLLLLLLVYFVALQLADVHDVALLEVAVEVEVIAQFARAERVHVVVFGHAFLLVALELHVRGVGAFAVSGGRALLRESLAALLGVVGPGLHQHGWFLLDLDLVFEFVQFELVVVVLVA